MKQIVLILLLLVSSTFATSYNFTETRYSDALERSMKLDGIIEFTEGLAIEYNNSGKSLLYEDGEVQLLEDGESIELDEGEALKIAQYFETVLMLYRGDKKRIEEEFVITPLEDKTLLAPKGELSSYMFKIELQRENKKLKEIVMYLSNYDKITISIHDEIR